MAEDPIRRPHDALFRAAFGDPDRAGELLRSVLPTDLAAAIDWRSLRHVDGSFVDAALRHQQADLLFTAAAGGSETRIYLLLEHKAEPDRLAAFQLLRYVVRIWQQFRRQHPHAVMLPPVLPFVLRHGAGPWQAPRDLRGVVDLAGAPASLVDLQPQLRFVLDDLGACDAGALHGRRLTVQSLLPLLHLQQLRRSARTASLLLSWRLLHQRLLALPGGQELVVQLISYVTAVSEDDRNDLLAAYAQIGKHSEEQYMTVAKRLLEEGLLRGREEGRLEGRQEGRQQGRQEGRIDALLILLRQRFGDLPDRVADRVRAGSAAALETWTRRVIAADTLDDVFVG